MPGFGGGAMRAAEPAAHRWRFRHETATNAQSGAVQLHRIAEPPVAVKGGAPIPTPFCPAYTTLPATLYRACQGVWGEKQANCLLSTVREMRVF